MLCSLQNAFTSVVSLNSHNISLGIRYFYVLLISVDVPRDGIPYLRSHSSRIGSQDSNMGILATLPLACKQHPISSTAVIWWVTKKSAHWKIKAIYIKAAYLRAPKRNRMLYMGGDKLMPSLAWQKLPGIWLNGETFQICLSLAPPMQAPHH